jgi:hypothetical protein
MNNNNTTPTKEGVEVDLPETEYDCYGHKTIAFQLR